MVTSKACARVGASWVLSVSLLVAALGCASSDESAAPTATNVEALTATCSAHTVQVVDLRGDLRDLWAQRETPDTGKQADPNVSVAVDFNSAVDPTRSGAQFVPVAGGPDACGTTAINATSSGAVTGTATWGTVTSDTTRPANPFPYNAFVAGTLTGIPSVAGAVAAGGNITLSGFSVNGTTRQPFGMISGGKVTLANGSIAGSVTYGTASTIPGTVTVSGSKAQQAFDPSAAFNNLRSLSTLLAEEAATGTATLGGSTLTLSGKAAGLNVFRVSADMLAQATSVQLGIPTGAGALVNVSGGFVSIQNKGFVVTGATAATTLWNIPDAGTVTIAGVSLGGSVLAPSADVTFGSGTVTGTVVARSLAMPGSGTLLSAPLNTTLLFSSSPPSSATFTPAQALTRGCEYQFVILETQPLSPSPANNCLNTRLSVTFRVAATPSTPAGRELDDATSDSATHTLRRFSAKSGVATLVSDLFTRYASGFGGVPANNFVPLASTGRASSTHPGATVLGYQQYAGGYPVFGYGYLVTAVGNLFYDANGKTSTLLSGVAPPPNPVSQQTALSAALASLNITTPPWVKTPAKYHAPSAVLGWMPKRAVPASASDFAFVWQFGFTGTGLTEPGTVQVDGATGKVLMTTPGSRRVTGLTTNATFVSEDATGSVTTPNDGRQTISVAVYQQSSGQTVTTLMSGDQSKPAGSLSVQYIKPDGTNTPIIPTNPSLAWSASTGHQEQMMATSYWGLTRANTYLQTLQIPFSGTTPWTSIDGLGQQQVIILWGGDNPATVTGYLATSDAQTAYINMEDDPSRTTIPHEYGHALLASIRRALNRTPDLVHRGESGSITEGLADLFAIGAIHRLTSPVPADWACLYDDGSCAGSQARDLANPTDHVRNPSYYNGTNYHTYTDINQCDTDALDNCSTHDNSTVIGYWGYLLGAGSSASPGTNPCNLTVDPLDLDPDKALQMVIDIAYRAASDHVGLDPNTDPEPTFADFRDATISVARDLSIQGKLPSTAPHRVELAWYAVGLGPEFMGDSTDVAPLPSADDAVPADDATSIYPWQNFGWSTSVHGDGLSSVTWDWQIADGSFDTNLKLAKNDVEMVRGDEGNVESTAIVLALPIDSTARFYWRVRPHTTGAWLGCFPVHSFQGTGDTPAITNIKPLQTVLSDGTVSPGEAIMGFTTAPLTEVYHVGVASQDAAGCAIVDDVFKADIKDFSQGVFTEQEAVEHLQPKQHYFFTVQPVGPPDFTGAPSVGNCYKGGFDTGALAKPAIGISSGDGQFHDPPGSSLVFGFSVPTETASSTINLYERDENGNCATTAAYTVPLTTPCEVPIYLASCPESFDATSLSLLNPTGYCVSVTVTAKNGQSTTSVPKQIPLVSQSALIAPGIKIGSSEQGNPSPLPGDSYGSTVSFNYQPVPAAFAYHLRVWKWEEDAQPFPVVTVDPPNCEGGLNDSACSRPKHIVYDQLATPAPFAVGQGAVSEGRYCWTAWPVMADPAAPGVPGPRQPEVQLFPSFCYTSGPSTPVVVVDNPTAPGSFPTGPILGHVHFDYVPDQQWEISWLGDAITFGPGCNTDADAFVFSDVHNCDVPFSINPQPETTYTIEVKTWNSSAHPPVEDATTLVHDVTKAIDSGKCGGAGEACCPNSVCDDTPGYLLNKTSLTCQAGTCVSCGGPGQPCCSVDPTQGANPRCENIGNATSATFTSCIGGVCTVCGSKGEQCCAAGNSIGPCPGTEIMSDTGQIALATCAGGVCTTCGHKGEPCCANTKVNPPVTTCEMGTTCNGGVGGFCVPESSSCPAPNQVCGSGCARYDPDLSMPAWQQWRNSHPGQPMTVCVNGQEECNPSLVQVDADYCCPPGTVAVTPDGTCIPLFL